MSELELLYQLTQDPDSYWIAYDLCLENNWASYENPYTAVALDFTESYSISGTVSLSLSGATATSAYYPLNCSAMHSERVSFYGSPNF
jgi:hypothetical protein